MQKVISASMSSDNDRLIGDFDHDSPGKSSRLQSSRGQGGTDPENTWYSYCRVREAEANTYALQEMGHWCYREQTYGSVTRGATGPMVRADGGEATGRQRPAATQM